MKNLLILLPLFLFGGNALAVVPKQSLFADVLVHKQQELDQAIIAEIEKIIPQVDRDHFCTTLIYLNNEDRFTRSEILSLFNRNYNKSGSDLTSLESLHMTELFKEQKNRLVQEMHDEMWKQINTNSMGDIVTEDYALVSAFGFIAALAPVPLQMSTYQVSSADFPKTSMVKTSEVLGLISKALTIGTAKGILLSLAAVCSYRLYNYRNELRSREDKMNKIDVLIKKIETLELTA